MCTQFKLSLDQSRLWLLVYDLHLRNFSNREPIERARQDRLYLEADVERNTKKDYIYIHCCKTNLIYNLRTDIHELIWKHRIQLAAALSRLRIQSGALKLSHLLPSHLQDDKVAVAAAVSMVTGWINPFKLL